MATKKIVCAKCGKDANVRTNSDLCNECRRRVLMNERYHARVAAALCTQCGKPVNRDAVDCVSCSKAKARCNKKNYSIFILKRLCARCHKPLKSDYEKNCCPSCLEKVKLYRIGRKYGKQNDA